MTRDYCPECAAEVPVQDGECFFGHEIPGAAPTSEEASSEVSTQDLSDAPDTGAGRDPEAAGGLAEQVGTQPPSAPDVEAVTQPDSPGRPDAAADEVDVDALEAAIAALEGREGEGSEGVEAQTRVPDAGTESEAGGPGADEATTDAYEVGDDADPFAWGNLEDVLEVTTLDDDVATPDIEPESVDDLLEASGRRWEVVSVSPIADEPDEDASDEEEVRADRDEPGSPTDDDRHLTIIEPASIDPSETVPAPDTEGDGATSEPAAASDAGAAEGDADVAGAVGDHDALEPASLEEGDDVGFAWAEAFGAASEGAADRGAPEGEASTPVVDSDGEDDDLEAVSELADPEGDLHDLDEWDVSGVEDTPAEAPAATATDQTAAAETDISESEPPGAGRDEPEEDGEDEPPRREDTPSIDPSSFTARDRRKREGLLARFRR